MDDVINHIKLPPSVYAGLKIDGSTELFNKAIIHSYITFVLTDHAIFLVHVYVV